MLISFRHFLFDLLFEDIIEERDCNLTVCDKSIQKILAEHEDRLAALQDEVEQLKKRGG